ncbi:YfiR family protein [Reichenbachiella versicolor]|uniref:YfiR family protein n=1 Tax=Reichenbachiella versicolor TaxID=1821036 RepID=UPI000D6DDE75|nr:YfiR family protein [Reichenbachiella versicolor]
MRKITALLLIGILFSTTDSFGQTEKLKTVFIYNFTKYIDWPEAKTKSDFEIAFVGSTPLIGEMRQLAQTRKVGDQAIKIKEYQSISDIGQAHIVIISPNKSSQLQSVLNATKSKNTLVITEGAGLVRKGSSISLIVQGNKLTYEISESNIKARSLNVSGHLLKLGNQIQ